LRCHQPQRGDIAEDRLGTRRDELGDQILQKKVCCFCPELGEAADRRPEILLHRAPLHEADVAGELPVVEREVERLGEEPARHRGEERRFERGKLLAQRGEYRRGARRVPEPVRSDEDGEAQTRRVYAPPRARSATHPVV